MPTGEINKSLDCNSNQPTMCSLKLGLGLGLALITQLHLSCFCLKAQTQIHANAESHCHPNSDQLQPVWILLVVTSVQITEVSSQ